MKRLFTTALLVVASSLTGAEVFEAALGREAELPGGKEADGIRGDFVLRSDKVEAVVSQNAPNRRANMSTFYGEDGVTPGCLFDLTLRGTNNDQLICFGPCGHGPVSYVKTVATKNKDEAAVEAVTTAPKNKGIFKRNEYRVRDGVQGIFVTTILRNETDKAQKVTTKNDFTRFNSTGNADGVFWVDAVDPDDKTGYAIVTVNGGAASESGNDVEIAPGGEWVIQRFPAVGRSAADAVGEALAVRGDAAGTLVGTLLSKGQPVTSGTVEVPLGKSHVLVRARREWGIQHSAGRRHLRHHGQRHRT